MSWRSSSHRSNAKKGGSTSSTLMLAAAASLRSAELPKSTSIRLSIRMSKVRCSPRTNPRRNAEGRIIRWYSLLTDIEELKRLKDRLHEENLALREQIDREFMFEEIVGASPALQTVLTNLVKVAPTDSTVLIMGETGTGNELISRAIHKRSPRAAHPFITVHCAAVPTSLIASELFGHAKGAFTGALH